MEKLKEKRQYPSQLNTKSIACRIPITDYVEIVNECVGMGINVNDWLLTKIYGKQIGSNTISNDNYSDEQIEEWRKKSENLDYWFDNDLVMRFPCSFGKELTFNTATEFIDWFMDYFNPNKKKTPSLIDAKIQISEIAKTNLSASDFRSFMKELNELLGDID